MYSVTKIATIQAARADKLYQENSETRNKGKVIPYQVQTSFIMRPLIGAMRRHFMQNCPQCARAAACKGNAGNMLIWVSPDVKHLFNGW